jgi:hypothetical protein
MTLPEPAGASRRTTAGTQQNADRHHEQVRGSKPSASAPSTIATV